MTVYVLWFHLSVHTSFYDSVYVCLSLCPQGVPIDKFIPPHIETSEEVATRAQAFLTSLLEEFDYLVRV